MSSNGIQLIVGLGNPGVEYEHTRHNAGVWFVENIAHRLNTSLRYESKFRGFHAQVEMNSHKIHLLFPTTYMNHSGQSVKIVADYYKISPQAILVAHDEIDLPCARIRLKFDGGDGGHNGLKDIIHHIDTKQFYRLRIGIGRPIHSEEVHNYVLSPPKKNELIEIQQSFVSVEPILPLLIAGDFAKAMQQLHT